MKKFLALGVLGSHSKTALCLTLHLTRPQLAISNNPESIHCGRRYRVAPCPEAAMFLVRIPKRTDTSHLTATKR